MYSNRIKPQEVKVDHLVNTKLLKQILCFILIPYGRVKPVSGCWKMGYKIGRMKE